MPTLIPCGTARRVTADADIEIFEKKMKAIKNDKFSDLQVDGVAVKDEDKRPWLGIDLTSSHEVHSVEIVEGVVTRNKSSQKISLNILTCRNFSF